MYKRVKKVRFGSTKSQMNAALKNLAIGLIENKKLVTTAAKARATQSLVERLVSRYEDNLNFKRYLHSNLGTDRCFDTIKAFRTADKSKVNSGFVSAYKIGHRKGDGALQVMLTLGDYVYEEKNVLAPKATKTEAKPKKTEAKVEKTETKKEEKAPEAKKTTTKKTTKKDKE